MCPLSPLMDVMAHNTSHRIVRSFSLPYTCCMHLMTFCVILFFVHPDCVIAQLQARSRIEFTSDTNLYRFADATHPASLKTDNAFIAPSAFFQGLVQAGSLSVDGAVSAGSASVTSSVSAGSATIATSLIVSGQITSAAIVPGSNAQSDLGSSSARFKDAYLSGRLTGGAAVLSGALTAGEATIQGMLQTDSVTVTGQATLKSLAVQEGASFASSASFAGPLLFSANASTQTLIPNTVNSDIGTIGDAYRNGWFSGGLASNSLAVIGLATFQADVKVAGAISVSGAAALGSLTTTGGAVLGSLSISTGSITSRAIIPAAAAAHDIGSASATFKDLFLSGTATATSVAVSGAATLHSLSVKNGASVAGGLSVDSLSNTGITTARNVVPASNDSFDFGTQSTRWRDAFLSGVVHTSALSASGAVTSHALNVVSSASIGGDQNVTGSLTVTGSTSLNGPVLLSGAVSAGGIVSSGNISAASIATSGSITAGSSISSTALTTSGLATVGSLLVSNSVNVTQNVNIVGSITVSGQTITSSLIPSAASSNIGTPLNPFQNADFSGSIHSGALTVNGPSTLVGDVLASGGLTVTGSATLTIATASSVSVAGTLIAEQVNPPSNGAFDLGSDSPSAKWRHVFASGTVSAGNLTTSGAATVDSLRVLGSSHAQGDISVGTNLTVTGVTTLNGPVSLNGTVSATSVSVSGTVSAGSVSSSGSISTDMQLSGSTLSTTGLATVSALGVANDANVNGTTFLNGPVVLSSVASTRTLAPNSAQSDLGSSSARYQDLWLSGTVNSEALLVSGSANLSGDTVAHGSLAVTGPSILSAVSATSLSVTGPVTAQAVNPEIDNANDLGTPSRRWRNIASSGGIVAGTVTTAGLANLNFLVVDTSARTKGDSFVDGSLTVTASSILNGPIALNGRVSISNLDASGRVSGASLSTTGALTADTSVSTGTLTTTDLATVNALRVENAASFAGDVSMTAPLTMRARILSFSIYPDIDTADLGASNQRYRNLWASGTVNTASLAVESDATVNGPTVLNGGLNVDSPASLKSLSVTNDATINGAANIKGPAAFTSTVTLSGVTSTAALKPLTDNLYDLGAPTAGYKNAYITGQVQAASAAITGDMSVLGTVTARQVMPQTHNLYDIGTAGLAFRNIALSGKITASAAILAATAGSTVGIGTLTPDVNRKLDVVGDARVSGELTVGTVSINTGAVSAGSIDISGTVKGQIRLQGTAPTQANTACVVGDIRVSSDHLFVCVSKDNRIYWRLLPLGDFAPTCSDGVQNGYETDADCGGSCPLKCPIGSNCSEHSDCDSGNCNSSNKCEAGKHSASHASRSSFHLYAFGDPSAHVFSDHVYIC